MKVFSVGAPNVNPDVVLEFDALGIDGAAVDPHPPKVGVAALVVFPNCNVGFAASVVDEALQGVLVLLSGAFQFESAAPGLLLLLPRLPAPKPVEIWEGCANEAEVPNTLPRGAAAEVLPNEFVPIG